MAEPPEPPLRHRTRSETLDDVARLDKAVAVLATKLDIIDKATLANAQAIALDTRADRSKRPEVLSIVGIVFTLGTAVGSWAFWFGRMPTKTDVAEVHVEAALATEKLEARIVELEKALAAARSEDATIVRALDAIREATRRDAPARRKP